LRRIVLPPEAAAEGAEAGWGALILNLFEYNTDIRAPALLLTSSMMVITTFITALPHPMWSDRPRCSSRTRLRARTPCCAALPTAKRHGAISLIEFHFGRDRFIITDIYFFANN
jgi:hypothetical protein